MLKILMHNEVYHEVQEALQLEASKIASNPSQTG